MLKKIGAVTAIVLMVTSGLTAAPRLVIPEVEFDFGFSPQNSAISHPFWLKSAGDDTLKIVNVVPGCGCTKAPLERDQIAAGDSTRVEIIFSTGSYQGAVSKSPKVVTNEGAPDKFLRIRTTVVNRPDSTYPLVIKPYKVDLSQFGEKGRSETNFTLINKTTSPLTPFMVATFPDHFDIKLPKTIPAGGSADGVIVVKPEMMEKAWEKSFTIELNDENHSRFTIPVKRNLRTQAQTSVPQDVNVSHK
ncbi:MAG: DUF1573 domain-containing protein [bacterium]|nr:DUF1573 domain-containing protein [bacterium]